MIASAVAAFVMGVAGSIHCVAMCGGVASATCGTAAAGIRRRSGYALAWSVGRVATYALLGALGGAAGAVPASVLPVDVARIGLRVLAALLLVGLGLHLAGVTRAFAAVERLGDPLWRRVSPLARRLLPVRSAGHAALLGAAWAFIPCGLVYAALSLAIGAGSFAGGALTMLAFGLGTMPAMTAVAALAAAVARRAASGWLRRAGGLVVLLLAAQQGKLVADEVAARGDHAAAHACCPKGRHH